MKKKIFVIYDYLTPNGYLPFYYHKKDLPEILNLNLKVKLKYPIFDNSVFNILTSSVIKKSNEIIKNNIFLIILHSSLKKDSIENIISKDLNMLLNAYPDNFTVIYHNYESPLQSFT